LSLVPGTNVEAWSAMLDGLAGLAATGLIARTGAGTASARTLSTADVNHLTVADGNGVSGNPTIDVGAHVILTTTVLGTDLSGSLPNATVAKVAGTTPGVTGLGVLAAANALAGQTALSLVPGTNVEAWSANLDAYSGLATTGVMVRTGAGTATTRTIATADATQISVTNGDGVAGNPTIGLGAGVLLTTGARAGSTASAQSFGTLGITADVVDVATAGVGVKIRGSRDFGALAADPAPVVAAIAGDRYYNTVLEMDMTYDGTRAKWLSSDSDTFSFNRTGNTAAGVYYYSGDQIMTTIQGYVALHNGTIVAMGATRSDNDAATFVVVEGGVSRATLASAATSVRSTALNGNFTAGGVLAVLNQGGGVTVSNVVGWVKVRWRA
jgi:hypothetical protein